MILYFFILYSFIYDTVLLYYIVYKNKILICLMLLIGLIEGIKYDKY